jgi:hypothetical protein
VGTKAGLFGEDDYFTPNSVNRELMKTLFTGVDDSVKEKGKELIALSWRFYVVEQTRGRCYYKQKVITIPSWVQLKKDVDYKIWYICHEMAHAYNYINNPKTHDNHGPLFMDWLIRLCPERCIENELEYKPRHAASAGIGVKKDRFIDELGF